MTQTRMDAGRRAPARFAWLTLVAAAALAAPQAAQSQSPTPQAAAPAGADVPAAEPTEITITSNEVKPIPISVPRFVATDPALAPKAQLLTQVISENLARSGLFKVAGGAPLESIDVPPPVATYKQAGVDALLAGEVALEADGRLAVRFRLWDVTLNQQLDSLQLRAGPNTSGVRRIAHRVADAAYSRLTGEDPYFDSRIVFVDETGPKDRRKKRLAIMDQDGGGVVYLTAGDRDHLVLTPRFSPAEQVIAFISNATGDWRVYLLDLVGERQEAIGEFKDMTFAPRFSPRGDRLLMSLERSGDSDIYIMHLASRQMRRLTDFPGIETAPSFAPDGSAIVFESDRAGDQQLYVMNPDGSNLRRISLGDGRYATPVWSPKGDLIAFTKQRGGKFSIGVMRPDGSDERILFTGYHAEGPTWAPNGRVLMFFQTQPGANGRSNLYTVDIYGRTLLRVPTPAGASDPAWSPLLKD